MTDPLQHHERGPDGRTGDATLRAISAGLLLAALLAGLLPWIGRMRPLPWLVEILRGNLPAIVAASALAALAVLAGTLTLQWARRRATLPPAPTAAGRRWLAWTRPGARGDALLIGRAARVPQALAVVPPAGLSVLAAAWLRAPGGPPAQPDLAVALGALLIVLAFPLLLAERSLAALPRAALPEAPALRALVALPMLAWPLAGLIELTAGLGLPYADPAARWLAYACAAVGAELAVRALLRLFLPPPAPEAARAATESALAGLLSAATRGQGTLAASVRDNLGIDFARSWALAYVRSALPAVTLLLLALCWGLSGIVVIGPDRRAVYERLGVPVAVLHPGLHLLAPWPLGRARWVDYGTLHDATLTGAVAATERVAAEAPPPPSADRLWEQEHAAEVLLLLASATGGQQGFQAVSLDLRMQWRVGMRDADALDFAYRLANPDELVRAELGRAAGAFFAARTLADVLGQNRLGMAEALRVAAQQRLDRFGGGIEVVAVVIEAIHPPPKAADTYHAVQAAEIQSRTSVSVERGRAEGVMAGARQTAAETLAEAQAGAAESTGAARADLARFSADREAAKAGGEAFLMERYLASLTGALARAPLTILDHRVDPADAPVLDIRPQAAGGAPATGGGGE